MASTSIGNADMAKNQSSTVDEEKHHYDVGPRRPSMVGSVTTVSDQTHRKLKGRHIQLIGIGGTIGTALYVQIGRGLMNGGPGSLFLAFTLWYAFDPSRSGNLKPTRTT
jgi:amino acid transporter